jgi:hypothetical protein
LLAAAGASAAVGVLVAAAVRYKVTAWPLHRYRRTPISGAA